MSNFKSGSGNLDFGGSDSDEEDAEAESAPSQEEATAESQSSSRASSASTDTASSGMKSTAEQQTSDQGTAEESTSESAADTYPYFVRRSNVGDERDTRLEIHVRDKVAEQESAFRNELAEQLGANEVSKTDAREFALLAAYRHPERVAELMREEGFDALY